MARFVYEAKNGPAEKVKGELVAENRNSAILKLSQMGYAPILVEDADKAAVETESRGVSFFRKVSLQDITDFTRKLSDMLESGLTIAKALEVLSVQIQNKTLKRATADILDHCSMGNSLSSALERHPKIFPELYVSMVHSGETGGALENILKRLADFSEKQVENQTKIKAALAYPILMMIVGLATIIILMTFVIPKMMTMFSDMAQTLPLPTRILLGISSFLRNYWWLIIAAIAAAVVTFKNFYSSADGKITVDRMKLRIPLVGQFETKSEIARFARTLATLLHNGVPILEALRVVSNTLDNAMIRQEMAKAYEAVKEGSSLAKGLKVSAVVPDAVISMVTVGEEGGNLERSLFKIAEGYERETDQVVKIMMSLMEPVMILILGSIVGFIVISMLLPIFEINFLVR